MEKKRTPPLEKNPFVDVVVLTKTLPMMRDMKTAEKAEAPK